MAVLKLRNNKEISDYGKPYIIAELGSNHNGDMELARKLIEEAKKAGCDCVKFQSWTKDTIFSKKVYEANYFLKDDYRDRDDYTLEEIVDEFSVSENELYEMYKLSLELDIDFTSTPFSEKEVDFLVDKCNVPFIKVASMDLNNYPFISYIAKKQVPIVLSTGLSDMNEITKAVQTIENEGNNSICVLHCISIYPPKMANINLNNISTFRSMYTDYPIGFSDHSIGTEVSIAAVSLGSCIVEKHFTLDNNMFGWDHKVSLNPVQMQQLVTYAYNVHLALGTTKRVVCEEETIKREAFRRSVVLTRDIAKGETLKESDIVYKRPGTGISPGESKYVIGRTLKNDKCTDEMILWEDLN